MLPRRTRQAAARLRQMMSVTTRMPGDIASRVLHDAADAVIHVDADDTILSWNRGASRMFGHKSEEAIGSALTKLIVPEKLRSRHLAGYAHVMSGGASKYEWNDMLRVPAQRKDGSRIPVEFTLQVIMGADGVPKSSVAIMRDVSVMSGTIRQLRERVAQLEKLIPKPNAKEQGE